MTDQTDKPWLWPEEVWRRKVVHVRGGRSLKPKTWKGGARCAVPGNLSGPGHQRRGGATQRQ